MFLQKLLKFLFFDLLAQKRFELLRDFIKPMDGGVWSCMSSYALISLKLSAKECQLKVENRAFDRRRIFSLPIFQMAELSIGNYYIIELNASDNALRVIELVATFP